MCFIMQEFLFCDEIRFKDMMYTILGHAIERSLPQMDRLRFSKTISVEVIVYALLAAISEPRGILPGKI